MNQLSSVLASFDRASFAACVRHWILAIILCGCGFWAGKSSAEETPLPPKVPPPAESALNEAAAVVEHQGGEANLKLPDLNSATVGGFSGRTLFFGGIFVCVLGMLFGLRAYVNIKAMPAHSSMLEVSELIYETCKTYLVTQGRFLLILEAIIAVIIVLYFGVLQKMEAFRVVVILLFSAIGIAGSYGVAWFGVRINTLANSRTAFASLKGLAYPLHHIPLLAGMSIGMLLISVELMLMLMIFLFIPGDYAGPCFIGFAIGESLGAAALRIAGGIFTKIADIGSDLMKIAFNIKEDDARNPGVIADCAGDNAGDSVGPTADGFETYGVTGVALITYVLLAVRDPKGADNALSMALHLARGNGVGQWRLVPLELGAHSSLQCR